MWDASASGSMGVCQAVLAGHGGPVTSLHVVPHAPHSPSLSHPTSNPIASPPKDHSGHISGEDCNKNNTEAEAHTEWERSMRGPLLMSGAGDGSLGLWDLSAAVNAQPQPALNSGATNAASAAAAAEKGAAASVGPTWQCGSALSGALPGCVWMQRVHRGGVMMLEDGVMGAGEEAAGGVSREAWGGSAFGGGLVVSGAEDGTLCAWHAHGLMGGRHVFSYGGSVGGRKNGSGVVQGWTPAATASGVSQQEDGVSYARTQHQPLQQTQQQQPLQLWGWQASRAASTCMAFDPVTGVAVSGGHDGMLRALHVFAPFAG